MKLEGKVAVITGGAQGIGAAIAHGFAQEGARVVIADIAIDKAKAVAEDIGKSTLAVSLDVRDRETIDATIKSICGSHGGLDILVNNAAIFDMEPLLDISEDSFDLVFAVNVRGALFTLQAAARQMVAQGRKGKIINIASQAGRRGAALTAVYSASKAAMISLTQSAGLALIKYGINVNAISPGVVDTPMWDKVDALFARYENMPKGQKKKQAGAAIPAGRMGVPDDYRGAAIFLASADSDYVVAQTLNVDGGSWMS
jgi:NAD(P)-dependent dehydrogenase (short-subunit alcohol dehydrogenase family)